MSAVGAFKITEDFEKALAEYCGSLYAVALDNCSSALFLALKYSNIDGVEVEMPSHTYMSVPCSVIHAGGKVKFNESFEYLDDAYQLFPTKVIDSALMFTADMYVQATYMCLSFTGPYKHLKLGKGGAILTDNKEAYEWFKKARFSGRSECSYHEDNFDENPVIGWNMYMPVQTASLGLQLMSEFLRPDGSKKINANKEIKYPDLSKFNLWK